MNKIVLNKIFDESLAKIIGTLCIRIQNTYDIYPCFINKIINDDVFISTALFLQKQYTSELQYAINHCKKCVEYCYTHLDSIINNNIESIQNNVPNSGEYNKCDKQAIKSILIPMPIDFELCGHKILLPNNMVACCDVHKYLHDNNIKHEYVQKTPEIIINNKYRELITSLYEQYVNKFVLNLEKIFMHIVLQTHKVILYETTSQGMKNFLSEMNENKNLLKCKYSSINNIVKCFINI